MDALKYPTNAKEELEWFEKCFQQSEEAFATIRKEIEADIDFSNGEQWDESIQAERNTPGKERPCLTINKVGPIALRIVNEAKQQKLELKVKPVDDKADPDTALILAGAIHNIEYQSNAIRNYMWAYDCMVRGGLGYFRIDEEYEEDSFDIVIKVNRIVNPLSVGFDPASVEQNGCDANWAFISEEVYTIEVSKYGAPIEIVKDVTPSTKIWSCGTDKVRSVEMWYKVFKDDMLYLFKDGSKAKASEVDAKALELAEQQGLVVKKRKTKSIEVKWLHFVNGQVYARATVNGKYIPVVRMVGRESFSKGKRNWRGITRDAKDANRMYNVMSSLLVEKIGLAPRVPWVGAAGAFDGFETQWDQANRVNYTRLEYNPIASHGTLVPPPQRPNDVSSDPAIERYLMQASQDIEATTSAYSAYMGKESNETSGVAIKARASQGNVTNYDLLDNCADSIEFGGKVILDKLARTTTKGQLVRILGEDKKEQVIKIGEPTIDPKTKQQRIFDFSVGKYDVEIDVGAGDVTKREFAVDALSKILQSSPENASIIMDVLVSNMDIKDADKVAKRFKALLPPNVIAAEEDSEKDNPELDAYEQHATQLMTELRAQLEETSAALQEAQMQLKNKDGELDIKQQEVDIKRQELELKEREQAVNSLANMDTAALAKILDEVLQKIADTAENVDALNEQMEKVTIVLEKQNQPQPQGASPEVELQGNEGGTQAPLEETSTIEEGQELPPEVEEQYVGEPNDNSQ